VDEGGRTLRHQQERWDAKLGAAELWVSLPRVEPGRRDNTLIMYWGNPLAVSVSSGPLVFGGLSCDLHMDPASDGFISHLQDASGKQNPGDVANRPASVVAAAPTEGIAGVGLMLDGIAQYVSLTVPTQSPQSFTLSLWLQTTSSVPALVADFASRVSGSNRLDRTLRMDAQGRLSFGVQRGSGLTTVSSLTGYNDGAWHHVAARSGEHGQYLFVDGEPIADDPGHGGATNGTGTWYFGANPPASGGGVPSECFSGRLDELQLIVDSEPSDDWIKLSYATQAPSTTVVRFEPL
jgi:hypothetical protein